jgi:pimeloyl-ACP methyl ester carboxylesterase
MDFCAFDFAGCGNSTGDWVTHGFREIGDLHIILNFLLLQNYTDRVIIIGRSLGAITALMYTKKPTPLPIVALVLDTVYADYKEVIKT